MTPCFCQGKPAARAIPARHAKILPALAPIRVPASSAHSAVDATAAVIAAGFRGALDAPTDVSLVPHTGATVILAASPARGGFWVDGGPGPQPRHTGDN